MLCIMLFNHERTDSCFMCKRLWKLETWTQLSVCNHIHPQQSSYLPISCHDCCCVAQSLCINGTRCTDTHLLLLLLPADYVLIFQLFFWFCFAFLVSRAFMHVRDRCTGRRGAWLRSCGRRHGRHFRRGITNGCAWGTLSQHRAWWWETLVRLYSPFSERKTHRDVTGLTSVMPTQESRGLRLGGSGCKRDAETVPREACLTHLGQAHLCAEPNSLHPTFWEHGHPSHSLSYCRWQFPHNSRVQWSWQRPRSGQSLKCYVHLSSGTLLTIALTQASTFLFVDRW